MNTEPQATADRVLELLSKAGEMEYHGERVSQLEHALQAAQIAREDGGSNEEIIAALLHDIGHIWPVEGREMTTVGVITHDAIGAGVLRELGFAQGVADIVAGHVRAKRYLVAVDGDYAARLSDASVESLRRQGGPMSPEEAEAFAQLPYFNETVRVRLWDDRAKTPGAPTDDLGSYREMLTNHIEWQQRHMA